MLSMPLYVNSVSVHIIATSWGAHIIANPHAHSKIVGGRNFCSRGDERPRHVLHLEYLW